MADHVTVDVDGIGDLTGALQKTVGALPDALAGELSDRARMIARNASGRVPRRTGAAQASVEVRQVPAGAEITAGGRTAPYYGFLDFGGNVGRRDNVKRPYLKGGRYLYPATNDALDDIEVAAARAVVDAGRQSGVEVTGG